MEVGRYLLPLLDDRISSRVRFAQISLQITRSLVLRIFLRLASLIALSLIATACLAGCSSTAFSPTQVTPLRHGNGIVMGGEQPVTGSTIQLYQVGTTGDGSTAVPLGSSTFTDSTGSFSLTGKYTCPVNPTLVYLVARGGNSGLSQGTNNPQIVLIAALGLCSSLSSSTYITINEITTVAAIAALYPYTMSYSAIGSGTSDASSLSSAFTLASEFASNATGSSPGSGVPSGYSVPISLINTLADIIATCIDTSGGSAGQNNACGNLFTDSAGATPTDTVGALVNIFNHPTSNTSGLYNLVPPSPAFVPSITAQPSSWTVALSVSGPYTNYSSYYTIPFVGSPSLKSLGTNLLHIDAYAATTSTAAGTTASFIVDTGSTGVVLPASEVTGYVNGAGTAGSITYSSSGLTLSGYYTNAFVSFPTAVNQNGVATTAQASLPVLAVTSATCSGNGINPCSTTIPHMLGVGFGRATTTYASPIYNPFVNLAEMSAGTMRRGYTLTSSGVQLGLTNATVPLASPFGGATSNYYIGEQLTASGAFPGYAYDWDTPTGSFVYAGTPTASGTVLFDTGLTDMLLENSGVAGGTTVPNNTAITINAIPSLVSYSFNSGDSGATTPTSVNWADYTHGVFVNVGNHFLGKYDYLYDADGGILGLRPESR